MTTINLKPKQASQTTKTIKKIIISYISINIFIINKKNNPNIINSKHNKIKSKCFRLNKKVIKPTV